MGNEIGTKGEAVVAQYLQDKNYQIVRRNYRTSRGEIDIIVKNDEQLKFVEVKTMLHSDFENLRFLIDKKKQQRIMQTAQYFLMENREYSMLQISFDVAVLKTNPFLSLEPDIVYLEHAFGDMYEN